MRNSPCALMLFAAGFGTRMGALTADRPKPLVPVAGRPLIDHALELTEPLALERIVANLHYRGDQIRNHLAHRDILFSDESAEILETGGGLRAALPLLGQGPVFTLNTDAVWSGPNPLKALSQAWIDTPRAQAMLLLAPKAQAIGYQGRGDFTLLPDGRLQRGGELVYLGAQILCPEGLDNIPERVFSLNRHWDALMAQGAAFGTLYQGLWCDVGRPEGIKLAEDMLHV